MKAKKSVVVIGAGLSGLSAAIYLTSYGFKVTLLERNPSVGGLCTGWQRKGFNVDGCIHWPLPALTFLTNWLLIKTSLMRG